MTNVGHNQDRAASGFTAFAREVHGFQKTLLTLVAGSFVTSGVASFAQSGAHDVSTAAIITLVGTLAGCFAVVSTYLAWPHRPDEERARLIKFDSSEIAARVRVNFALSLVCLILYAALPLNSWTVLLPDAAAIYFFFVGLVSGTLAARDIDRQEALWIRLDPNGRQLWREWRAQEHRARQKERLEASRIHRETTVLIEEGKIAHDQSREFIKKFRRKQRRQSIARALRTAWGWTGGRAYRLSLELRRLTAGDRLLTKGERVAQALLSAQRQGTELILRKEWAREAYGRILAGQLRASRDEQSGLEYYGEWDGLYLCLKNDINAERARMLVDQTAPFRSGPNRSSTILLTEGEVTLQAEPLLAAAGITVYWPADWQRTSAETPDE